MLMKTIEIQIKNAILSVSGIIIQIMIAVIAAIPATYSWNMIAPIYLKEYIPEIFLNIDHYHMVALFLVCSFLGEQIQKITPKIISFNQEN